MAAIRVVDASEPVWISTREYAEKAGFADKLSEADLSTSIRVLHKGEDDLLDVREVDTPPNVTGAQHAHDADEVLYVIQGSMILGSHTLGVGSSVFIAADTMYSFRSGAEGLRFINFRPRGNVRTIMKDEFLASRQARAGKTAPDGAESE
jgi:quercetin dioxygenase-like cupin family protein